MAVTPRLEPALLRKLEALRLAVGRIRWGSRLGGRFPINRRGSSVEFADYAAYTPGDDIRTIDWNLYARLDRLFVRIYQEEVELSVEVMVDATASMGLPTKQKFERAQQIGLCLAYLGLAGHHHVRMSWIKPGPLASTRPGVSRADITRLSTTGASVTPGGAANISEWIRRAVVDLRLRGGQALIISDCMLPLVDIFRAVQWLLVRRLEVKIIQVLSPQELHPARLVRGGVVVDSETGLTHELSYRAEELERAVIEHNEQLARFCARNGVWWAQHQVDDSLEDFVLKTLPARGFLD